MRPGLTGTLLIAMLGGCGLDVEAPTPTPAEPTPAPILDPWFVDAPEGYVPDLGAPRDVAAGDLDGDGDVDLVFTTTTGGGVLWNTGRGAFEADGDDDDSADPPQDAPLSPPWGGDSRRLVSADFDGDGISDVFACHGKGEQDRLFLGSPGGPLESWDEALPLRSGNCKDVAAADMDGDGTLDVVLLARDRDLDGGARSIFRVLLNRGQPGAPRFVLHDGLEQFQDQEGLPLPDGATSSDGVEALELVGGRSPEAADLRWTGATAGATVRVTWAVSSSLQPRSLEVEIGGTPPGATVVVAVTDADGERFIHESGPPAGGRLRIDRLDSVQPTGDGDELLTRLQEVSLAVTFDAAPPDGALELGTPVVETVDGGRILLASFSHPIAQAAVLTETWLAVLDLDGDGALDLAASRGTGGGPPIRVAFRGGVSASDGTAGFVAGDPGRLPAALDGLSFPILLPLRLEDDDVADLFAVGDGQDRALRNDGAGWFFDDSVSAAPVDAAAGRYGVTADLDRDGLPELLVANDGAADRILHPDGAGRLVDWTARAPITLDRTTRLVVADVDGDGDLDFVTWGPDRPPRLLVQTTDREPEP